MAVIKEDIACVMRWLCHEVVVHYKRWSVSDTTHTMWKVSIVIFFGVRHTLNVFGCVWHTTFLKVFVNLKLIAENLYN